MSARRSFRVRGTLIVLSCVVLWSGARARAEAPAASGQDLYELVRAYADLGFHRVGTDVDARQIEWFASELERRGGKVELQPFDFDRFEGSSTVTIDGEEVPSMPLYYEGVGEVESDDPFVDAVAVMEIHRSSTALLDAIARARAAGAAIAVIATENPEGLLQTPNRTPKIASGLPVVLVPGGVADELRSGKVSVSYSARIVPGQSSNVVATFGDASSKPIVVATPLSGWFNCAAERGTGIAIALGLARRLAPNHPVVVVGSPGHELLHHIGLEAFLEHASLDPAIIIHLGANAALGVRDPATGEMRLAPGIDDPADFDTAARTVFVRMDPGVFESLRPILERAGLPAVLNPPRWYGEGELWAEGTEAPLMSFTGLGPQFHSPADLPEDVTSPELLETVYRSIGEALDAFMAQSTPRARR